MKRGDLINEIDADQIPNMNLAELSNDDLIVIKYTQWAQRALASHKCPVKDGQSSGPDRAAAHKIFTKQKKCFFLS